VGFLKKVFENKKAEEIDIEEFLNTLDDEEDNLYEEADAYVKPISLQTEEDVVTVVNETRAGNIILLNITDLSKRNSLKLKEYVTLIKNEVDQIDGDIARISHDRVLITPSRVKIVKKR